MPLPVLCLHSTTCDIHCPAAYASDISVLKFILVLVYISFTCNHFFFILLQFFPDNYFSFYEFYSQSFLFFLHYYSIVTHNHFRYFTRFITEISNHFSPPVCILLKLKSCTHCTNINS